MRCMIGLAYIAGRPRRGHPRGRVRVLAGSCGVTASLRGRPVQGLRAIGRGGGMPCRKAGARRPVLPSSASVSDMSLCYNNTDD
jgi:hypothetical protein